MLEQYHFIELLEQYHFIELLEQYHFIGPGIWPGVTYLECYLLQLCYRHLPGNSCKNVSSLLIAICAFYEGIPVRLSNAFYEGITNCLCIAILQFL